MAERTVGRRVAELIGLVGVVGSLVFVGLEVRQSTIATRAATDAAVADGFRELNLMFASSPELARAMTAWADDPEAAPPADRFLILGAWRALFYSWSNGHRQHLNGTLDPAIYEAVVREISTYAGSAPGEGQSEEIARRQRLMQWAWRSERFLFNPDFQTFVDSVLAAGQDS
jgi:hypothetical protein